MFLYLASITPKPDEMKQEAYERTLRARAFDISRYLLPLAANTSLGEIVNARTLENQVSHLLSHTHKEIRQLGELLKRAATSPAYNVNQDSLRELVEQIRAASPELGARAEQELLREVRVAPTLVKYADPNQYEIETRRDAAAGGIRTDGRLADCAGPDRRSSGRRTARGRAGSHVDLRAQPLFLPADSPGGAGGWRADSPRDHRPGAAKSRPSRRNAARLLRRATVPLRHPDGYRRLPRHAPPPPLHSDRPGVHHQTRIRRAR